MSAWQRLSHRVTGQELAGPWYQWDGEDLLLAVHVQPRASTDSLDGIHGDRLKVRLTAPPVDGKANSHLIRLLAKHFGVPCRQVLLLSGENSRAKRLRIQRPRQMPAGIPACATRNTLDSGTTMKTSRRLE